MRHAPNGPAGHATTGIRVEPNVTPMIDVMLVLLIIFMVVTPVLANGARPTPPVGRNLATHPDSSGDVVLAIDERGGLVLDGHLVSPGALVSALSAAIGRRPLGASVYVVADRRVAYAAVRDAVDAASHAGAHVVGLVAERLPAAGTALR